MSYDRTTRYDAGDYDTGDMTATSGRRTPGKRTISGMLPVRAVGGARAERHGHRHATDTSADEAMAVAHDGTDAECGCELCLAVPNPRLQQKLEEEKRKDDEEQKKAGGQQGAGQPAAGNGGQRTDGQGDNAALHSTVDRDLRAALIPSAAEVADHDAHAGSLHDLVAHAGVVVAAKPPGFDNDLGETNPNFAGFVAPKLEFDMRAETKKEGGLFGFFADSVTHWFVKVKATTSTDATHKAVATPAGKHPGKPMIAGGVTYQAEVDITPQTNQEIVSAEQEHLDDWRLAYEATFQLIADVINAHAMATKEYSAKELSEAVEKAKKAVLDNLPDGYGDAGNWYLKLLETAKVTKTERDAKGTHTHEADPASMKIDHKAKKVTYGMKPGPNMRRFPASSIIKVPTVKKP